jgi:hypothetical protein
VITVTNAIQAGTGGLEDSIGACKGNTIWVTKEPAQKSWFSGFVEGLHKRVGKKMQGNFCFEQRMRSLSQLHRKSLMTEEIHARDRTLDWEFLHAQTKEDRK